MTTEIPPIKNKLHGKVVIVTGGASGIGEVTARHIAYHGADAVVIADIDDDKGRKVAASIGPDRCTYIHCDVTDEKQVKSLVDSTVSTYGRVDVMFSNAGIITTRSSQTATDLDLSAFDKVFAVNARGMAACVKHAARAMKEKEVKGSIICTASALASRGYEYGTDYVMSKHAVLGLVRAASMQLAGDGIRVNCVSPGTLATAMMCDSLKMDREEVEKTVESLSWLKGVLKEKHVADAVVFLASDDSEFITGHNLAVDGIFVERQGWK